jgi:hypothetical protein
MESPLGSFFAPITGASPPCALVKHPCRQHGACASPLIATSACPPALLPACLHPASAPPPRVPCHNSLFAGFPHRLVAAVFVAREKQRGRAGRGAAVRAGECALRRDVPAAARACARSRLPASTIECWQRLMRLLECMRAGPRGNYPSGRVVGNHSDVVCSGCATLPAHSQRGA